MIFKLYTEIIPREVIDDTFLIKFDDLKEKIISFKNLSNDELMNSIHWGCIELLKNYLLNTNNYLKKCSNELELDSINLYLWKYAFENFKLLLNINHDYDKIISIKESFQNFNDINCKNNENSEYERDFENFKKNLKRFIECDDNSLNKDFWFNKKFNNRRKYNIYKDLSTIFTYTIDNWGECAYNDQNIFKKNIYMNDGKFLASFLALYNININDLYYFERIHNINFKIYLHKYILKLYKYNLYLNESEIIKIIESFSAIMYLPNVFNNTEVLLKLTYIFERYYRNYDIEDFRKSVEALCSDFVEYFLPLYNSIFFEILHFYCEINNINIKDFNKELSSNTYSKLELLNGIKDQAEILTRFQILIEEYNKEDKGYNKKQKKVNIRIYYLINRVINSYFNFDRLKNESIMSNINIINARFLKDISDISDYQLSLKEFILKINNLKLKASEF